MQIVSINPEKIEFRNKDEIEYDVDVLVGLSETQSEKSKYIYLGFIQKDKNEKFSIWQSERFDNLNDELIFDVRHLQGS